MEYPLHLNEKIREELAISYLGHEFKKIFPSIEMADIENLMLCKEISPPRDFWNGIHGVAMGFKLKIGFIYLITAENISWEKKIVPVNELSFGVELSATKRIKDGKLGADEVIEYYKNDDERRLALIETYKIRGEINNREEDPIIVMEKMEGSKKVLSVYDGNGRLMRHILEEKEVMEAFVGRYTSEDKMPKNYWLPTSVIMDNLYFVYEAIRNGDEEVFKAQIKSLKYMLKDSESGRMEFESRALTTKEPEREKILIALGAE